MYNELFLRSKPDVQEQVEGHDDVNQMMAQSCSVCGDHATGFNYGVLSCEACELFFKMYADSGKRYQCPAVNKCGINGGRRNACQACRYQRCLEAGMVRDGQRSNRVVAVSDGKFDLTLEKYEACFDSERKFKCVKRFSFSKECEFCLDTYLTKATFMNHKKCYQKRLAAKNKNNRNRSGYEFTECNKCYGTRACLRAHTNSHFNPGFGCKLCSLTGNYKQTFIRHSLRYLREYEELRNAKK